MLRANLPACVHGRIFRDQITHARWTAEPRTVELLTLVHELAHWLAHRDAHRAIDCTLFEYEAEAVEALVMARLRPAAFAPRMRARPTTSFLRITCCRCSVARVGAGERADLRRLGAPRRSCRAQKRRPPSTSTQRPVKKSFSNMNSTAWAISSGCPRRFSGTGAVSFSSTSGRIEARMSVCVKPGAMRARTRIPKRRELLRPYHAHGFDARLGGAVVGLTGVADPRNTGNIHDDAAMAEANHLRRRFTRA